MVTNILQNIKGNEIDSFIHFEDSKSEILKLIAEGTGGSSGAFLRSALLVRDPDAVSNRVSNKKIRLTSREVVALKAGDLTSLVLPISTIVLSSLIHDWNERLERGNFNGEVVTGLPADTLNISSDLLDLLRETAAAIASEVAPSILELNDAQIKNASHSERKYGLA